MSTVVLPHWNPAAIPVRRVLHGLGLALMTGFIFFACFAFSDVAPYDVVAVPTMLVWLCLGIRLHRGALPFAGLMLIYVGAVVVALVPYLDEPLSVIWTVQLAYLAVTGVFFAMFFSDDVDRRVELALKVYTASTLFSAALGLGGYLGLIGEDGLFSRWGRASGTFQDPNVFGSFLILGALYLMHDLLSGRARRPIPSAAGLMILLMGILLSFSRGSWAAAAVAIVVMVACLYRCAARPLRRRIALLSGLTLGLALAAFAALLSVDSVAETLAQRAAVTQDYDEGETGRFGNQLRGLPMLVEEPIGMGPLRWRRTFEVEPHNSYIGSFANGGWVAGVAFILLVGATGFVGVRLMLAPSPCRRFAQIVVPALLVFFLQALQIDIEKWRHVYMMLGMVWGLEAARVRWRASDEP
ncbi:MAG: O-antigen ligase family protein [Methylobacterium frigidaeris]